MASRMDRYNEKAVSEGRSNKNKNLYNSIYNDSTYKIDDIKQSNIAKPISIEEIRNMLKQKEEVKEEKTVSIIKDEEKTYDINDALSKKHEPNDYKIRSIDNSKYDYLNHRKTFEEEQKEVEQLINTISTNSLVNKELAVDLLEDLKSNTMIGKNNKVIDDILDDVKDKTNQIDTSFYTKSLTRSDFEELRKNNENINAKNVFLRIIILLIILIIIAGMIYLFQKTE